MPVALIAQPETYHVKVLLLVSRFLAPGSAENSKRAIADHACIRLGLISFCAGGDLYKKEREKEEASRDSLFHYSLDAPCCLSSFSLFFSLEGPSTFSISLGIWPSLFGAEATADNSTPTVFGCRGCHRRCEY